jgi:hypothetical protein
MKAAKDWLSAQGAHWERRLDSLDHGRLRENARLEADTDTKTACP